MGFVDAAVHVIVVPPPKGPLRLLDLLSPAPPTHPPACACACHVHVLCVYTLLPILALACACACACYMLHVHVHICLTCTAVRLCMCMCMCTCAVRVHYSRTIHRGPFSDCLRVLRAGRAQVEATHQSCGGHTTTLITVLIGLECSGKATSLFPLP